MDPYESTADNGFDSEDEGYDSDDDMESRDSTFRRQVKRLENRGDWKRRHKFKQNGETTETEDDESDVSELQDEINEVENAIDAEKGSGKGH